MAIPSFDKKYLAEAIKYIDENGVPERNLSTKYELVWENGNKYPPKYVIAVAHHLSSGSEIDITTFNAVEAKGYFESRGYIIESKQQKFELTITADEITSTDDTFSLDDITAGDVFKPLDASFVAADGTIVKRSYRKNEKRNVNQTLPRIAFQVFESQISNLSLEEKEQFPICQYAPDKEVIKGIFYSKTDAQNHGINPFNTMVYHYGDGRQFVIYSWNIFSTIRFVQECLKKFGNDGDCFKLIYREKSEKENLEDTIEEQITANEEKQFNGYLNPYSEMLIKSKNIIFRGAPGTGKTYLAREIATDIISNGYFNDYTMLSDEQKKQMEFVQFHPSYDYSDFVEGLRPKVNIDGSMGFALQAGVFKLFVDKARTNYENSRKSQDIIAKEVSVQEAIDDFFSKVESGKTEYETINGSKFNITNVDDSYVYLSIPENASVNSIRLNINEIKQMLESGKEFKKVKDIKEFFNIKFSQQSHSYMLVLYNKILALKKSSSIKTVKQEELKKYVFIIDEINRGEISKILGELFFSIDPSYRGHAGEVSTQYSNMHTKPEDKFYIPENVYIIGTMNDIDRSVDSFDFAMRRRFRFVEIKADDRLEMLTKLNDEDKMAEAIERMTALNDEIAKTEGLNENYQIGASYFLKLKTLDFNQLWTDFLHPLLQEYITGMYDEVGIMERFEKAYGYKTQNGEISNEPN